MTPSVPRMFWPFVLGGISCIFEDSLRYIRIAKFLIDPFVLNTILNGGDLTEAWSCNIFFFAVLDVKGKESMGKILLLVVKFAVLASAAWLLLCRSDKYSCILRS